MNSYKQSILIIYSTMQQPIIYIHISMYMFTQTSHGQRLSNQIHKQTEKAKEKVISLPIFIHTQYVDASIMFGVQIQASASRDAIPTDDTVLSPRGSPGQACIALQISVCSRIFSELARIRGPYSNTNFLHCSMTKHVTTSR